MMHVHNYVVSEFEPSAFTKKVLRLMLKLSRDRYFGRVEFHFVNGEVTLVKKEECFKPGNLNIVE